ncbi:serine metalloprotease [Caballeronia arationis]|uniref:S8 family peptidase n=1 Tax=Caballeronia arationis TaxID=1777142 RepID=UPI00074C3A4A|nr:S8 family serine peptidase [Caballeronia arationis]SAL05084.1 serine metalloprotease [Caballeronia arationis]
MKQHFIVKMAERHPHDDDIPDWITFIGDKSGARHRASPDVDLALRGLGCKYWLTNEYAPAGIDWDDTEARHGLDRTYRVILQENYDLPHHISELLSRLPSVEDASPLQVVESRISPPAMAATNSINDSSAGDLIGLSYARALTRGSPDITIAVLDTGVGLDHPELAGKVRKAMDFVNLKGLDTSVFIGDFLGYDRDPADEVGHGTHVSGILAARGLAMDEGIAPDCSLMAVRVLAAMKSGDSHVVGAGIVDNINAGIKWAVDNGADIINMSLGIKHIGGGLPHEDVIRYALSRDVTVVAASGNDGSAERYYPGALPGVIAVGAVDNSGAVASFTSYGANIFVVAPGLNIYSSFLDRKYAFASGTSQASPFVAGAIGLMKSLSAGLGKKLGNDDIRRILKCTSDRVDSRMRNEHAGYGLLNLADGFKLLAHLL